MHNIEKLLRELFDFQRFEKNERLDNVISSVEGGESGIPLDDSRLDLNAAGESDTWRALTKEDDKH